MNIAFDMSFTQSLSNKRGIGQYTRNLIGTLTKLAPQNKYHFFYAYPNNPGMLKNFLKNNSIDIFHITSPIDFTGDYIELQSSGVRIAVTLFDLIPQIYPHVYLSNHTCKENYFRKLHILKSSDLIFAISETSKKDAIRFLDIDPDKIIVIMGGIDEKFIIKENIDMKEINTKYNITKPYILFSGGNEYRKNLVRFLEAFSRLPYLVQQYKIVLFNELSKDEIQEINYRAHHLGILRNIVITGFLPMEDLIYIYNGAELFVFPSLYEGLGLPVLEAMACGVPVLTSNSSSLKEIAENSAYLVNPEDVNEIITGLHIMLTDKELRNKLKMGGLNQVKKYTWEDTGKKVLSAFHSIMENNLTLTMGNPINEKTFLQAIKHLIQLNNEQFLQQLYLEILNRKPDPYGFEQHLKSLSLGIKKIFLISSFLLSEEANLLYSSSNLLLFPEKTIGYKLSIILGLENQSLIYNLFEELFNRPPFPSELTENFNLLNTGTSKLHLFNNLLIRSSEMD